MYYIGIMNSRTPDMIERNARRLGYDTSVSVATTGSRYITCVSGLVQLVVRVADHGECYCTADISVDPDNFAAWQAVQWLASRVSVRQPGWVTRAERRHEAQQTEKRAAEQAAAAHWALYEKRASAIEAWLEHNMHTEWHEAMTVRGKRGNRLRRRLRALAEESLTLQEKDAHVS